MAPKPGNAFAQQKERKRLENLQRQRIAQDQDTQQEESSQSQGMDQSEKAESKSVARDLPGSPMTTLSSMVPDFDFVAAEENLTDRHTTARPEKRAGKNRKSAKRGVTGPMTAGPAPLSALPAPLSVQKPSPGGVEQIKSLFNRKGRKWSKASTAQGDTRGEVDHSVIVYDPNSFSRMPTRVAVPENVGSFGSGPGAFANRVRGGPNRDETPGFARREPMYQNLARFSTGTNDTIETRQSQYLLPNQNEGMILSNMSISPTRLGTYAVAGVPNLVSHPSIHSMAASFVRYSPPFAGAGPSGRPMSGDGPSYPDFYTPSGRPPLSSVPSHGYQPSRSYEDGQNYPNDSHRYSSQSWSWYHRPRQTYREMLNSSYEQQYGQGYNQQRSQYEQQRASGYNQQRSPYDEQQYGERYNQQRSQYEQQHGEGYNQQRSQYEQQRSMSGYDQQLERSHFEQQQQQQQQQRLGYTQQSSQHEQQHEQGYNQQRSHFEQHQQGPGYNQQSAHYEQQRGQQYNQQGSQFREQSNNEQSFFPGGESQQYSPSVYQVGGEGAWEHLQARYPNTMPEFSPISSEHRTSDQTFAGHTRQPSNVSEETVRHLQTSAPSSQSITNSSGTTERGAQHTGEADLINPTAGDLTLFNVHERGRSSSDPGRQVTMHQRNLSDFQGGFEYLDLNGQNMPSQQQIEEQTSAFEDEVESFARMASSLLLSPVAPEFIPMNAAVAEQTSGTITLNPSQMDVSRTEDMQTTLPQVTASQPPTFFAYSRIEQEEQTSQSNEITVNFPRISQNEAAEVFATPTPRLPFSPVLARDREEDHRFRRLHARLGQDQNELRGYFQTAHINMAQDLRGLQHDVRTMQQATMEPLRDVQATQRVTARTVIDINAMSRDMHTSLQANAQHQARMDEQLATSLAALDRKVGNIRRDIRNDLVFLNDKMGLIIRNQLALENRLFPNGHGEGAVSTSASLAPAPAPAPTFSSPSRAARNPPVMKNRLSSTPPHVPEMVAVAEDPLAGARNPPGPVGRRHSKHGHRARRVGGGGVGGVGVGGGEAEEEEEDPEIGARWYEAAVVEEE